MAHIHAKEMLAFAQDAMETDRPWERWQWDDNNGTHWKDFLSSPPIWHIGCKYRRKSTLQTININGFEVPEPEYESLNDGEIYYLTEIFDIEYFQWRNSEQNFLWLSMGLVHKTKEAAEIHRDALLSFTKQKY